MTEKKFAYKKKNGEKKNVDLVVLNEDDKYLQGIDLEKLDEEEKEKVRSLVSEYEMNCTNLVRVMALDYLENLETAKKEVVLEDGKEEYKDKDDDFFFGMNTVLEPIEEKVHEAVELVQKQDEEIKPFIQKAYRKYIKENIV